MATIKKVADMAGVSVGTVSHVLTGSVQVSEALRLRVQAVIDELDYHPNHVARSLKKSKTSTLGIIVPDLTIPFYPQIIGGAETAARLHGYSLIAVNSADDAARQKDLLTLLRSQRVEGILLIVAAGSTPVEQVNRMIDAGIPVVYVDRVPEHAAVDSVSVDDVAAAEMGVDHLMRRGYRRIAIVTGPLSLRNEQRRFLGYRQQLERAGLAVDERLVWEGNFRSDDVGVMVRDRLRAPLNSALANAERPDALFCTNGPAALGALYGLRDSGLETPRDMGLVTFDELTAYDLFNPAITTIVQPAREIGASAAGILLQRIGGNMPEGEPVTVRLTAALKARESTRRVPAQGVPA